MKESVFAIRGELSCRIWELQDAIKELSEKRKAVYQDYIAQLNKVLPKTAEKSVTPAEVLDLLDYSSNQLNEVQSSLGSLLSWAHSFRTDYKARKTGRGTVYNYHSSLPTLKRNTKEKTHHYAELDESGNIINKWDKTVAETTYWIDNNWTETILNEED